MCSEYERRGIRFCITDPKWLRDGLLELPIKFHLFVDVGMHREGVPWYETNTIKEICKVVGNRLEGICSHLSNGLSDSQVLATEEERFRDVLGIVPEGLMVHLSNSASLYNGRFPYATHFRPGIALYGYGYPGLKTCAISKGSCHSRACLGIWGRTLIRLDLESNRAHSRCYCSCGLRRWI